MNKCRIVWVCICSLNYPACNMHGPYYITSCGLPDSAIFSTTSLKRHDFLNNVIEREICVLIFSAIFVWKNSHSKKNWKRCYSKCKQVFMWSTRYSCQVLIKPEFSRIIFEILWNIKFDEDPFNRSRVVPCGREDRQTDRQTDRNTYMTDLLLTFRKFSKASEKFTNTYQTTCFDLP